MHVYIHFYDKEPHYIYLYIYIYIIHIYNIAYKNVNIS